MKLTRATKNLKHNFKSEEESAAYHEKRRQDLAKKIEAEKKLKDNLIFLPKDSKDHKSIEGMLKKYGIEATEKDVEKVKQARKRLSQRGYCIVEEKFSKAKTQLTELVIDELTEFIKTNKELKELYGDEDNWYNLGNVKIINFAPANGSKGKRHDNRTWRVVFKLKNNGQSVHHVTENMRALIDLFQIDAMIFLTQLRGVAKDYVPKVREISFLGFGRMTQAYHEDYSMVKDWVGKLSRSIRVNKVRKELEDKTLEGIRKMGFCGTGVYPVNCEVLEEKKGIACFNAGANMCHLSREGSENRESWRREYTFVDVSEVLFFSGDHVHAGGDNHGLMCPRVHVHFDNEVRPRKQGQVISVESWPGWDDYHTKWQTSKKYSQLKEDIMARKAAWRAEVERKQVQRRMEGKPELLVLE